MKCGFLVHPTNFTDWERFHAERYADPQIYPDHGILDRGVALVDQAEELGFDKLWTTEHHATPYGLIPNPNTFLSFVAGRTRHIDVGTMVIVAPWWQNPIRAAEEIALVDSLLQGRHFTVGFGRGVSEREFNAMAVDRNESRGRMTECIEIIRLGLSQECFSYHGEFFDFEDVVVHPRPRNDLLSDMVGAFSGPESLETMANLGIGMINISGKAPDKIGEDVAAFNTFRARRGLEPMQPIIQFIAFPAETEDQAEEARGWFSNFTTEVNWNYRLDDPSAFEGVKGYERYLQAARGENNRSPFDRYNELLFAGTPDTVIKRIRALQEQSSAREFVVNIFLSGMPLELAQRTTDFFAREVLPAIHEMDNPIHEHCLGTSTSVA
jgi:alkanesulfonate monooxygenase SsuD/methylene tetrahydromethanopterin reductase-like flavin-dependent oxidoreductase (luciferase family)